MVRHKMSVTWKCDYCKRILDDSECPATELEEIHDGEFFIQFSVYNGEAISFSVECHRDVCLRCIAEIEKEIETQMKVLLVSVLKSLDK